MLPQRTVSCIIVVFANYVLRLFPQSCETVLVFLFRQIYELCFHGDLSTIATYLLSILVLVLVCSATLALDLTFAPLEVDCGKLQLVVLLRDAKVWFILS